MATFPAYPPNPNNVIVGPYDTARSGSANWGVGNGRQFIELITVGQKYRVRQNGSITRVRLYTVNKTGLTGFYVNIWRKNGATYDLVGTTGNIVSDLTAAAFTTVILSSPITGVLEGDYIGMRIERPGGGQNFCAYVPGNATTYYEEQHEVDAVGMDWESEPSITGVMPIELYMQAPQAVLIGDSIISGYPAHYSFLHTTATTDIASTIANQLSLITGYTYQNMGISGQTSTQIAARFTADLINLYPQIAIVEAGINDLSTYVPVTSKATFLANWTTMLAAAQESASISKILALKILPWTDGSNAQHQIVDDWNSALVSLASNYSKAVVVDAGPYVGQFRAGGDAGNYWDIKPENDYDGVHFTSSGHGQIARALALSLVDTSVSSGAIGGKAHMIQLPYGASAKELRLEFPSEWNAEEISGVTIEIRSVDGTSMLPLDSAELWDSDPVTLDGDHVEFGDQITLDAGLGTVGDLAPWDRVLIGSTANGPAEVVEVRSYDSTGKVATLTDDMRYNHADGATITGLWATYDLDLSDTSVWTQGRECIVVWTPNNGDFPQRARAVVASVALVVSDLERRFQALHPREYDVLKSPVDRFATFRDEAIVRLEMELGSRGLDIQRVQDQPSLTPVIIEQMRWLSLLNADAQDADERAVCREELTRQIELLCKLPLWSDTDQDGVESDSERAAHPVFFERGL